MKALKFLLILSFSVLCLNAFSAGEIIVAKDGSGQFTTINDALNSIPANNTEWKTIVVKNGVYDEHVMIKNNFIAIVGESRKGTRIEHNLPRASWYAINGVNTGTGVVNVWTNMHDVVIANMYIRNTFEGSEDYTEVIRTETGTTRIWVVNCDVLCLWKDTFAPWGKAGGMYYVADCAFRGSIDAFCPRGYCYALNSTFTETKSSSPIWHEGVAGENQRLVVQGGSVHSEYNKNVKLQNSQNYAQFYYLDVKMSDSIAELGKSMPTYFYGVTGLTGLSWFANNISLTERKVMDAAWTFENKWNPENTMPSVLPFAGIPQPYNGRYSVPASGITLKWIAARNAISHKVYFGKTEVPEFVGETAGNSFDISSLEVNTTYYWKVVAVTSEGEIGGNTWRFTTSDNINPVEPAKLLLIGKNNQTIKLGENISPIAYKMTGASLCNVTGLPAGVNWKISTDTVTISGQPQAIGTFAYVLTTTDAIQNASASGTIVVRNPNDTTPVNPTDTTNTDYTSTRLAKYVTKLDCLTMPQEPAWIGKSGSVAWTSGTGYRWGSTSAVLTLKVNGCTSVDITFTNTGTSRPIIISDGGSGNEKTDYPAVANSFKTVTFVPKSTGDDDISIKTSGSSGLVISKIIFSGIKSAVNLPFEENTFNIKVCGNVITTDEPVNIFYISGKIMASQTNNCKLHPGIYIIQKEKKFQKLLINK